MSYLDAAIGAYEVYQTAKGLKDTYDHYKGIYDDYKGKYDTAKSYYDKIRGGDKTEEKDKQDKFDTFAPTTKSAKVFTPVNLRQYEDREGLKKAYTLPNKVFVNGDTAYIAGTKTWQDRWDDLKIPFQKTNMSWRYAVADDLVKNNRNIKNIVGHSLGGSVALELEKRHPDRQFKTTTYGAPVWAKEGETKCK